MADTPEVLRGTCKVEAGEAIDAVGIMLALDTSAGTMFKASDAANRRVVGINQDAAASGDDVVARRGIYCFDNSESNAVAQTDIGTNCYVEDENTVTTDTGTNSVVAGKVIGVESGIGVWVEI